MLGKAQRDTAASEELTIDQLAARVNMTVRNVRAYASRGLIPPPRLEGRTGFYNHVHIQRLQLVRELIDRGYTLAAVEKALLSHLDTAPGHALELLKLLESPMVDEEPEIMTRDSLATLAQIDRDDGLIDSLVELGLAEWLDADHINVFSPSVVRSGAGAVALGLKASTVIDMLPRANASIGAVAEDFVKQVHREIWLPFVEAGMPEDQWDELIKVIESLLPIAGQTVLSIFRMELARAIDAALGKELASLGDTETDQG